MKRTLLVVILILLVSTAPGYASSGQSLIAISFEPDTLFAYMANAINPIDVHITLTDELGEHLVANIDPSTIHVNNNIIPSEFELIVDSIGFSPNKVIFSIPAATLIDHYIPFYDLSLQPLTIEGAFTDAVTFQFEMNILLRGHSRGDLNRDDSIDIQDLLLLVGWLFKSGELPFSDPGQADMNKDSNTNVADLVELIRVVFY